MESVDGFLKRDLRFRVYSLGPHLVSEVSIAHVFQKLLGIPKKCLAALLQNRCGVGCMTNSGSEAFSKQQCDSGNGEHKLLLDGAVPYNIIYVIIVYAVILWYMLL